MQNKDIKFLYDTSNLEITRRHLPHWTANNAAYFITFRIKAGVLSKEEQFFVLNIIKDGNQKYYHLFAAIVMPDHIHIILTPEKGFSLSRILKRIKGSSARRINELQNKKGSICRMNHLTGFCEMKRSYLKN